MLKRLLLCLLCLLLPLTVLADSSYLIPHSSTRYLTEAEVWAWNYEAMPYLFNEILARHGYRFIDGGEFDRYFRSKDWYIPNSNPDNDVACYPYVSDVEWYNINLIKDVRDTMRETGFYHPSGRSVDDVSGSGSGSGTNTGTLNTFETVYLHPQKQLAVYSAPDFDSWRAENSSAYLDTGHPVVAAGWDQGWLLVMYETQTGIRAGYVKGSAVQSYWPERTELNLDRQPALITSLCAMTDDPVFYSSVMTSLRAGTQVTWLASYNNEDAWHYIETRINGQTARGFIPASCLELQWQPPQNQSALPAPELLPSGPSAPELLGPELLGPI